MKAQMKTYGYAVPTDHVEAMIKALDQQKDLTKYEDGSLTDPEGHVVRYKHNDNDVFFCMIHSSRKVYLVRALEGLLTLK